MWTLTTAQVGTIIIVAALAGAAAAVGLTKLVAWSERPTTTPRHADDGRGYWPWAAFHNEAHTMTPTEVEHLLAVLRCDHKRSNDSPSTTPPTEGDTAP